MNVKLGKRVDTTAYKDAKQLREWSRRFGQLWLDLHCDAGGIIHHTKRIEAIERRINDADYCEANNVTAEHIVAARESIQRHGDAIKRRRQRFEEATWQFVDFWKGKPEGAVQWLQETWWGYADEMDDVLKVFPGFPFIGPIWEEIVKTWDGRSKSVNAEPCPF